MRDDDNSYAARRAKFRRQLTIYGRKAVLEALLDPTLDCRTLHLADSNRPGRALNELLDAADRRGVARRDHSREALSRISRNGRQDQGVALDIACPRMRELTDYLAALDKPAGPDAGDPQRLIALDGVTNPQNLGMVLRSATAAGVTGILHADRGNPALGPLVIKTSAGTLFRAPVLRCARIDEAARACVSAGFQLYRLQAGGSTNLFTARFAARALFVLGGESEGLSAALQSLPGEDLHIPMAAGVESLNVAVSAALVAYAAAGYFDR